MPRHWSCPRSARLVIGRLGSGSTDDGDAALFRERAIAATRQLAKRQFTWLRGELDARWFDPVTQRTPLDAAVAGFLGPPRT